MVVKVTIKAVRPSYAIGVTYRARIRKLVKAMNEAVVNQVKRITDKHTASDAKYKVRLTPKDTVKEALNNELQAAIKQEVSKWFRFFDIVSQPIAETMAKNVQESVDLQLANSFKKTQKEVAQQLTVGFSKANKQALKSSKIIIENNVGLIKSIPAEYHKRIDQAVTQAMLNGRDRPYLIKELEKIEGTTAKQIQLISKDQLRKATSAMDNERRAQMGITKAIWRHSGGDKTPRPEHLKAHGREYVISEGCPIKNEKGVLEYIQVGEKINCTCYSESVIEFE